MTRPACGLGRCVYNGDTHVWSAGTGVHPMRTRPAHILTCCVVVAAVVAASPAPPLARADGDAPAADPADAQEAPAQKAAKPKAVEVYAHDFAKAPGEEWSNRKTSRTPKGDEGFLGEFGKEEVRLRLTDLPEHTMLRVSFDLFILRSWDGNHRAWGPDTWRVGLGGGPTLLETSFGYDAVQGTQSYPDEYPAGQNPMETGAARTDAMGFAFGSQNVPGDAVYKMEFTLPHRRGRVEIAFAATGNLLKIEDESWGLDNVRVAVLEAPAPLTDKELQRLWTALASDDAVEANAAKWALVAAGEPAARLLRKKLGSDEAELDAPTVRRLIAQLDARDWRQREEAMRKLMAFGPALKPALRLAAHRSGSAEIQTRADWILAQWDRAKRQPGDDRRRRALRALEILTWAQGQALLDEAKKPGGE